MSIHLTFKLPRFSRVVAGLAACAFIATAFPAQAQTHSAAQEEEKSRFDGYYASLAYQRIEMKDLTRDNVPDNYKFTGNVEGIVLGRSWHKQGGVFLVGIEAEYSLLDIDVEVASGRTSETDFDESFSASLLVGSVLRETTMLFAKASGHLVGTTRRANSLDSLGRAYLLGVGVEWIPFGRSLFIRGEAEYSFPIKFGATKRRPKVEVGSGTRLRATIGYRF